MDINALLDSDGLFQTTFPEGWSFTWRLLTVKEHARFRMLRDTGAMHQWSVYGLVFDRCYIGDSALLHRDLPAGIAPAIGQCIMWLSGDCESETLANDIEQARSYYPADGVKEYMKRIIFTAFPSYVEEDADSWTYPELIRKFTVSEIILKNRGLEYQVLDTKKIHSSANGPKRPPGVRSKEELERENRELDGAMGQREHMLDMHPAELMGAQKKNQGKLSPSLARQLDRRQRVRG